jgi:long-chain acyl-CoA synthetase
LKNYLGLARLRHVYTGGAPLGQEIFNMFMALNVNIKQAYGMTEQTAASIIHRTDDIRLDTVGQPLPGIEFKISDTGSFFPGATPSSKDTTRIPKPLKRP